MDNQTFKKWNTITGWVVFGISLLTYLSTIEPNFSFWDCGEYISSAVKLEVTHAPGAALFQLVGAVMGIFALGNGEYYSLVINATSALFSAFTILFLFWTITHLVRNIFIKSNGEATESSDIAVLFAGVIGALSFTFSDTFWFSAVEGEVYAMASMFIALLLWLIVKWEREFDTPHHQRWLILISFIIGLSVGVHMMCMLAIPAICLIFYAKKYEFSWRSFLIANGVTLLILALVFKFIFPLIMSLFGKTEIFAVNGLGLPFNSGTAIAFIILVMLCLIGLKAAIQSKKSLNQTIALSVIFMIIGFSCWLVIPIRANANPPMNLNNPNTAIGMLDYYNREQYGDWPTIYGQNYTAQLDNYGIERNDDGSYKTIKDDGLLKFGDVYEPDYTTGEYRKVGERFNYVYAKAHTSFMPRMFNESDDVMSNYISMYGAPDFEFNFDNPYLEESPEAEQAFDELRAKYEDGSITLDDYLEVKKYNLIKVKKPSFWQNFDYFISFQNGYYNFRYLLWNFAGRQNDLEGHMENTKGNWISGFSFIDNLLLGNQEDMPKMYSNESTVKFYFLPLILGFIGFYFQVKRDFGRFYALLSLFVLTSVGIIFYTGVKPFEPRERDYAMVGSFYAFAIWIGLGAGAILNLIQRKFNKNSSVILTGVVLLFIPMMMGFQNYTPHDRSKRYAAYDYAYSVLKSLNKDNIIFVYGDNDTYPLWAIQETEGFRDDVKVVNFTLAQTPWYLDQIKRRTYNSMPVPSSLKHEDYRDGTNDQILVFSKERWKNFFDNLEENGFHKDAFPSLRKYATMDSISVKDALRFLKIKSAEKDEILKFYFGDTRYERFNFIPCNKMYIPVNKSNAIKAGIIRKEDLPNTVDNLVITYKPQTMFKNGLMLMDILAHFDWKRTINFSSGGIYEDENIFFLNDYLQFDGFSYRLVPIQTKEKESGEMGRVVADDLYRIVKNYRWGNFKDLSVHFDETCTSNIVSYRSSASRAADALASKGQKAKAVEILDLANREIPVSKYNDPRSLSSIVYGYIISGQEGKGLKLAESLKGEIFKEYDYYAGLSAYEQKFAGKTLRSKPFEYSLVVGAVVDAYKKMGKEDKGYQYLVKSIEPIDKRYENFIKDLEQMGKERAMREADNIQKIAPFYQFLFEVMKPYDSTYQEEKLNQITNQIMKVTQ